MNKGRRHELKMLKYKKRLKKHRIAEDCNVKFLYRLRSMGKPCSCAFCSPGKVLANGDKKKEYQEIQFEINEHCDQSLELDDIIFYSCHTLKSYTRQRNRFEDILMYA